MRLRRLQLLPLVFALATLAGCGAESTSPKADASFVGLYKLKTINGGILPWTMDQSSASKTEVTKDEITFKDDGTFTETATYRVTENGTPTTFDTSWGGVFSQSDDSVQLVYLAGAAGSLSGSVTAGTLTLTDSDQTYVYTK